MSHNINEDKMFSVKERPWHGIGTILDNPATALEAIKAAKLDYEVKMVPALFETKGKIKTVRDRFFTVREDTGDYLSDYALSENYKIIQNKEAFGFFDYVIGKDQAVYETAGALGRGERIWIMAKLPKSIILKNEHIEKYLLLTTSHDGKSTLKMYFTPIRVVCQNTLNMTNKDAKEGISIRHRGDIQGKIKMAQEVLGIANEYYHLLGEEIKKMMDYPMNTKKVDKYYNDLLGISETDVDDDLSIRIQNQRSVLLNKFEYGKGNDNPKIRHSLWAAYNGVTEYVDHYKTVRNVKETPTNKLEDIWFGNGANIKNRAYVLATQLMKQ